MRIAIHKSNNSYAEKWIRYCEDNTIEYKIVNCYDNDIIKHLQDCDVLMWHFHHASEKDVLFAKQLLYAVKASGKKVFPNYETVWHFDDKVAQKYLCESLQLPLVNSYVFYIKQEALKWASSTAYPKVFKLRGGAGSVNVRLVKNYEQAIGIIRKSFGRGFRHSSLVPLKEVYEKYKKGMLPLSALLRRFVRSFTSTKFAKISGREIGYAYFQDFIPGNDHDIRVIVINNKAFAIKRLVRENDFRASGSGTILYDKKYFDEATVRLALDSAKKLGSQCVAFDFVYESGIPYIVELSYGFSTAGYEACPGYWDENLVWHEGKFNPYGWMIENLLKN